MSSSIVEQAKENIGIQDWGAGYFSINRQGDVVAFPEGSKGNAVFFRSDQTC